MQTQLPIAVDLLKRCEGVRTECKKNQGLYGRHNESYKFFKEGDTIVPPKDFFVEVVATATKGTIGKVIDVETECVRFGPAGSATQISMYGIRLLLEVDGREKPVRIKVGYTKWLEGYTGVTKYVRNVKQHEKVEVKNPVNKYKQELQRGDWVIGVMKRGKGLGIGRITRWTNHNVWGVRGDDLDDKDKEFQFDSIRETFLMPNEDFVSELTMAVLKGWDGR